MFERTWICEPNDQGIWCEYARVVTEPVPRVKEGCLRKHVLYRKCFERDGNQFSSEVCLIPTIKFFSKGWPPYKL